MSCNPSRLEQLIETANLKRRSETDKEILKYHMEQDQLRLAKCNYVPENSLKWKNSTFNRSTISGRTHFNLVNYKELKELILEETFGTAISTMCCPKSRVAAGSENATRYPTRYPQHNYPYPHGYPCGYPLPVMRIRLKTNQTSE
ncbi:hypothetical protein Fcan01_10466 [Folsomia candida]|uniref:Uncharacterized protein n=1 Tax=Folsomia candida TaxID=158441 RepID=A0A226E9W1_FOLCA|nr:hypothetical protein Fcan01_10466 [Folsomia candida]